MPQKSQNAEVDAKVTSKVPRGPGESVRITDLSKPDGGSNPRQRFHEMALVNEPHTRDLRGKLVSQQWAWLLKSPFTSSLALLTPNALSRKPVSTLTPYE